MKKKNVFFSVLATASLFATAFTIFSCGNNDKPKEEQQKIYELAKESGFAGTYEEWLATVKGADGKDGREIELSIQDNKIVWHYKGETTWKDIYSINDLIGPKGDKGEDGKEGVSISKIEKTSTDELMDTYTITYSDGTTSTFIVTNGKDGVDGEQGIQGVPGINGATPTISINSDGYWVINDVVTEIKSQGIKGDTGDKGETGEAGTNGKSAYELYLETHPEYTGTVQEWLDDLVNGRLGNEEKIYHTIKFITDTDDTISDQKVENFHKIEKPSDPVKEGYTFEGWYAGDEKWTFSGYSVTEDITLTAHWSINSYTITIDYDNGIPVEKKTLNYEQELNLDDPTKIDSVFDHWENEKGQVISLPYIVKDDINIKAVYRSNIITISFDSQGGGTFEPQKLKYEEPIVTLPTPVKQGNLFTGWYIGDDLYLPGASFVDFTKDVTFTSHYGYENNDYVYEILDDDTIRIVRCKTPVNTIPNKIDGKIVTDIASFSFMNLTNLKDVVISKDIKKIGVNPFVLCGIKSIHVDENNKYYDSRDNCNAIIEKSSNRLVSGCINTIIPSNAKIIGGFCFGFISNLEYINLPDGLERIEAGAFSDCRMLKEISLPKSLKYLGLNAFYMCSSLKSANIPESIRDLKTRTFASCSKLENVILNDNIVEIGDFAFSGCDSLTSIILPNSLIKIGNNTFSGCSSLMNVVIPNSVETIKENAFEYCDLLDINCEASSKPNGWDERWNPNDRPVIWGYKGN